jgi:hypothetical protein
MGLTAAIKPLKYSTERMLDVGCQPARCLRGLVGELSEQEQDDVTAIVELLQELGSQLPFPHSSGVEGSRHSHMRELRIQSHGDPLRVFYAFDPTRSAVLLIGGNKTGKDKRFYKTMIPKADALYDQHLNNLQSDPKP